MVQDINPADLNNKGYISTFQEKVIVIADEVLDILKELNQEQGKFKADGDFEKSISLNMNDIKQGVNFSGDIKGIKAIVFRKIEHINKDIEEKKIMDLLRLKEIEKTLANIGQKMIIIKKEADAIRKKTQEAELESLCDDLTGLYNRKSYDRKIEETLAHLARYNVPSSLLVCDIDYFKRVNDNFGHLTGDLTLKEVAEIFKKKLRKNDFIARYGGDEFICILPHTLLEEARKVAEEIRSFIERTSITLEGKEVPVTISIGVSTFRKGDNALTVFERADVSIYMAKNSGRNLVKTEVDVEKAGETFSNTLIDRISDNAH